MELQELKDIWNEYDRKLDRNLQLNMQLLKQLNLDKAKNKLNRLLWFKGIEIAVFILMAFYLGRFIANNWPALHFIIAGLILASVLVMWIVYVVKQLAIIADLQMGYADAIAPIQKKIEQLKLHIVNYTKYSFVLLPLYPVMLLVAGKAFLHVDFFEPQRRLYFLSNVAVGLVLIPVALWFFKLLSAKNIGESVSKNLLVGTGWHQANSAHNFLNEIEKFEQEDQ
jgi:hypothetical protein